MVKTIITIFSKMGCMAHDTLPMIMKIRRHCLKPPFPIDSYSVNQIHFQALPMAAGRIAAAPCALLQRMQKDPLSKKFPPIRIFNPSIDCYMYYKFDE